MISRRFRSLKGGGGGVLSLLTGLDLSGKTLQGQQQQRLCRKGTDTSGNGNMPRTVNNSKQVGWE